MNPLQSLLRRMGFELSCTPSAVDFLTSRHVELVLDVGANKGQYARGLRAQGYQGRIHSFEPIIAVYAQLTRAAAGDPLWTTTNCAVGAFAGSADINVSDSTVYSSIRSATPMSAAFSRKSAVVRIETVPVVTLDSQVEGASGPVFLKIDTQGFEREVLLGAGALMSRIVGLQLELPVEHLYQGVWSFNEAFVDSLGFAPAQFRMVNALHDDAASGNEFYCIFRCKR